MMAAQVRRCKTGRGNGRKENPTAGPRYSFRSPRPAKVRINCWPSAPSFLNTSATSRGRDITIIFLKKIWGRSPSAAFHSQIEIGWSSATITINRLRLWLCISGLLALAGFRSNRDPVGRPVPRLKCGASDVRCFVLAMIQSGNPEGPPFPDHLYHKKS